MKVLIVEDEQPSLELYKEYLRLDFPELELTGAATNLRQAREILSRETPDLALLDIRLDEDKSTIFELLEELQTTDRLNFDLIFVTAHGVQEYMLQALEFSALKYITKPVNRTELRQAVEKALDRQADRETIARQLGLLLERTRASGPALPARMAVPLLKGLIEMVELRDILYIHSYQQGTMTQLFLNHQTTPLNCTRTIGKFREILGPAQGFFPIHESTLLNLNQLQRYDPNEKTATLVNGAVLFASRRGGQALRQYLLEHGQATAEAAAELPLLQRVWRVLRGGG